MKETIVKINKIKSWYFEKINKNVKLLGSLIKEKKKKRRRNKSKKLEMKKERFQQRMQKCKGL